MIAHPTPSVRPTDIDRHVGAQIRARRLLIGVMQQQLAREIGVSSQQMHKYETGINRVSAANLWGIARALGCEVGAFFPGSTAVETDESRRALALMQDAAVLDEQRLGILCTAARGVAGLGGRP